MEIKLGSRVELISDVIRSDNVRTAVVVTYNPDTHNIWPFLVRYDWADGGERCALGELRYISQCTQEELLTHRSEDVRALAEV